ncbi:hypothetical protein PVAP13_1KG167905 [Panicum virgatum]|uniref:Uncharacterized protein n=1 Tax=Panicum virgatum TaxID=38727 RepID=A0A8T0XQX2_PANVG|nr:hypothetical protein PVAP13_1KG167905 [Panicum virgatum]
MELAAPVCRQASRRPLSPCHGAYRNPLELAVSTAESRPHPGGGARSGRVSRARHGVAQARLREGHGGRRWWRRSRPSRWISDAPPSSALPPPLFGSACLDLAAAALAVHGARRSLRSVSCRRRASWWRGRAGAPPPTARGRCASERRRIPAAACFLSLWAAAMLGPFLLPQIWAVKGPRRAPPAGVAPPHRAAPTGAARLLLALLFLSRRASAVVAAGAWALPIPDILGAR